MSKLGDQEFSQSEQPFSISMISDNKTIKDLNEKCKNISLGISSSQKSSRSTGTLSTSSRKSGGSLKDKRDSPISLAEESQKQVEVQSHKHLSEFEKGLSSTLQDAHNKIAMSFNRKTCALSSNKISCDEDTPFKSFDSGTKETLPAQFAKKPSATLKGKSAAVTSTISKSSELTTTNFIESRVKECQVIGMPQSGTYCDLKTLTTAQEIGVQQFPVQIQYGALQTSSLLGPENIFLANTGKMQPPHQLENHLLVRQLHS
jgi:hypothetical protein